MSKGLLVILLFISLPISAATSQPSGARPNRHVFFLYDASRSYADDYGANYDAIDAVLRHLSFHDSFSFAMIGNCGDSGAPPYDRKRNEMMKPDYHDRKYDWIDKNSKSVENAIAALTPNSKTQYTDVEGSLRQAAWELHDEGGEQFLVIFSDMDNDPASECNDPSRSDFRICGTPRADLPSLIGIHVVVFNMTFNADDVRDSSRYECRRSGWGAAINRANALSVNFMSNAEDLLLLLEDSSIKAPTLGLPRPSALPPRP